MKISVDANVLARGVLQDDSEQGRAAAKILEEASLIAVSLPCLCERDITALLANLRYRLEPRLAASGIELKWHVDVLPVLAHLDANAMRQLRFMLFEALSNVLQHANASELCIEAVLTNQGTQLRLVDNGRGFDATAPLRKGLQSMRERAQAMGATLSLHSVPGRTVLEILIS